MVITTSTMVIAASVVLEFYLIDILKQNTKTGDPGCRQQRLVSVKLGREIERFLYEARIYENLLEQKKVFT